MTATELPLMTPGSADWLRTMSASKVAAALGLSPFESPFSLWHRMAGNIGDVDETDEMRRGHYLEPAIAQWWQDQNPGWACYPTGTWQRADRPWQTASPDRTIYPEMVDPDLWDAPTALLECKTSADDHEWGEPGTDEIPVYYRVQAIWQMDTTGIHTCHVACLTSYLEFRAYVIEYDPDEAAQIVAKAAAFMDTLETGQAPQIDSSTHTYQALRQLHPDIEPVEIELTNETAHRYLIARDHLKRATDLEQHARSLVADEMGNAQKATWDGHTIARRQARKDGTPYVVVGRNLPALPNQPQETEAA